MLVLATTWPTPVAFLTGQGVYVPIYVSSWYWWAFMALTVVVGGTAFRKDRVRRAWRRHVMEGNMPLPLRVPAPLPPGTERQTPTNDLPDPRDAAPTS